MSITICMWLGISFVVLAILAVLLQAWLWNPKYWNAAEKKSYAPRWGMWLHRIVGIGYIAVYVVMMWEMVPRLWEYQVELPARTVIHAVMGIVIGVLLITKVLIIRFFRHFEESMPTLGMSIMMCTIVSGALSLPFAIQAHDLGGMHLDPENRERVRAVLEELPLDEGYTAEGLTSDASLSAGRVALVEKCTPCHDLRTILNRPRSGDDWLRLSRRMAQKPVLGDALTTEDVLTTTAYLISITPGIQRDLSEQREHEEAVADSADMLDDLGDETGEEAPEEDAVDPEDTALADGGVTDENALLDAGVAQADPDEPDSAAAERQRERRRRLREERRAREAEAAATPSTPSTPVATAETATPETPNATAETLTPAALFRQRCIQCHGMDEIRGHGPDDRTGWIMVLRRMVSEQDVQLTRPEAQRIVSYLVRIQGR